MPTNNKQSSNSIELQQLPSVNQSQPQPQNQSLLPQPTKFPLPQPQPQPLTLTLTHALSAIHHNNPTQLNQILQISPHLSNQLINGQTLLSHAAGQGANSIIKVLFLHNVDINNRNKYGTTALIQAITHDHISTVKLLCERGVDVQCRCLKDMMSPVDLAILHGLYSIASYLYGRINEKRLKQVEEYRRIAKEYLLRFVDYEVIIDGLREGKEEGQLGNYLKRKKGKKYGDEKEQKEGCWKSFLDCLLWRQKKKSDGKGQQNIEMNVIEDIQRKQCDQIIVQTKEKLSMNQENVPGQSSPLKETSTHIKQQYNNQFLQPTKFVDNSPKQLEKIVQSNFETSRELAGHCQL